MSSTIEVKQAYSRDVLETLDLHTLEQAQQMLATAHGLYRDRSNWLPTHERMAILDRLTGLMEVEQEKLALLIANEGGKPLIDAQVEVARAIDGVRIAMREMATAHGEEVPMNLNPASQDRLAFTTHEPVGVVVAISAFNHPLNLIVHQVIPAVATGCPVIVKPATSVPLSCLKLVQLLHEAGLPEPWAQVLLSRSQVTEAVVTDPRVGFFTFIGSAGVGWMLKSKLAPGTRCALEHGGVAPVVVDQSANIDKLVPLIGKGGFYHAGQVCVSVQRVYAHESVAQELAQQLSDYAQTQIVGDAVLPDTQVGPLIEPYEVTRIHEWVSEAKDLGGKILTGGDILGETTYQPTVIYNPPLHAKVSQQEVFGPVINVVPYRETQQAIDWANGLSASFQAAVFAQDMTVAFDVAKKLDGSAVMMNDHTAFRVDWMPFAGYRTSGYGVGGIPYTMEDMWQKKMLVINTGF